VRNNNGIIIKSCKIIYFLITFSLINLSIIQAQEKSPIEVVKLFDKAYGSPSMDEIANYTTPKFRDNRPKSVWVVDTWKTLKEIKYQRLHSAVIDCKVQDDRAAVATEAKIKTVAGETAQKEIFYLVKEKRWLIDQLIVTDEEIDPEKMRL
jgi:hypothetical protein